MMISLLLGLTLAGIDMPPFGVYQEEECDPIDCQEVISVDLEKTEIELAGKGKVCLPGPDGIIVCL